MVRGRGQAKRAHPKCGNGLANPGRRQSQRNAVVREDGMSEFSRRDILSTAVAAGAVIREPKNPHLLTPPATDSGTLPNLRFSFADAHVRQSSGGWTRQVTARE